ncbi:MAG: hypothetical protein ACM3NP_02460 [Actinomycetota bacterium]
MNTLEKLLHRTPRILFILAIAFISLFAFDAFSPGWTFLQNLGSLMLHLVPTFILIALLVVAWKWELAGGILITLVGLVVTPFLYNMNYQRTSSANSAFVVILMITLPFIIIGILFIISHFIKRKHREDEA